MPTAGPTAREQLLAGLAHCDQENVRRAPARFNGATRAQGLRNLGRRRLFATRKRATNALDIDLEALRERREAVRMERLSQSERDQERSSESVLRQLCQ